MPQSSLEGSLRLFQVAGISVYVHWTWLLVAYFEYQTRQSAYTSPVWNVLEYVTLFAIVLLHEFGHALACRQVGGQANEIMLWPLGGVAFVKPPPRPGAVLWSIAAGPLVNVLLVPVTVLAFAVAASQGLQDINPDASHFVLAITVMNLMLLIFNLLPLYPLDGGQILQALLWFVIGRAKSLLVASIIGMVGVVGFIAWAVAAQSIWIGLLAVFAASQCWSGFQQARLLARTENLPRHADAVCPSCRAHPFAGDFWICDACGTRYDTFAHRATCPGCGKHFPQTRCPECGQDFPIAQWFDGIEMEPRRGEPEA